MSVARTEFIQVAGSLGITSNLTLCIILNKNIPRSALNIANYISKALEKKKNENNCSVDRVTNFLM